MAIELTALLNVKDKGFRNQMAKNLMDLQKLTKNEWAVRVAAKEEGFDGLKESLDYFNKDNGQIGYWELSKEQRINEDSTCAEVDDYDIKLSVYTNKKCIHSELLDKTIIK